MTEVSELLDRYFDLIGIDHDAPWLRPPATDAQIAATERALGFPLPSDLKQLLRIHNGGNLLDGDQWTGAFEDEERSFAGHSTQLQQEVFVDLRSYGALGSEPGPRALEIAGASQTSILYDMDTEPGRLLYLDVISSPAIIPLCQSISTLVDAYIALAEAGHITVGPIGPTLGPDSPYLPQPVADEITEILLAHHVAPASLFGNDAWLADPRAARFTI